MNNSPLLFLDTGIGGLPYLEHFRKRCPNEKLIYVADRLNFPYGAKGREELADILINLFDGLIARYSPKLAVLACNTASVSGLDALRRRFSMIPWVGTVPAVKPAVLQSRSGVIGVIGTERTIADPYIKLLAEKFRPGSRVLGIAAPDLVEFIEYRLEASAMEERITAISPHIESFREHGVDGVVLGCTHFLCLLDEFKAAAGSDMAIYDSLDGVSSRVEQLLDIHKIRAGGKETPLSVCHLTGGEAPGPLWEKRAASLGLELFPSASCSRGFAP